MKHREFVYIGEPIPTINPLEHADFILHFQKSMVQSLVTQKLLTSRQAELVIEKLTCTKYKDVL